MFYTDGEVAEVAKISKISFTQMVVSCFIQMLTSFIQKIFIFHTSFFMQTLSKCQHPNKYIFTIKNRGLPLRYRNYKKGKDNHLSTDFSYFNKLTFIIIQSFII